MMKKSLFTMLVFCVSFTAGSQEVSAQSKQTNAEHVLEILHQPAILKKAGWTFRFSEDRCTLIKQKQFKEKDGSKANRYQLNIPLGAVLLEVEQKKYDSFFRCESQNLCIDEFWYDREDHVFSRRQLEKASLFLNNMILAKRILQKLEYQKTLCERTFYPGPAGLQWGDQVETVSRKLSGKFNLLTEKPVHKGILFQQIWEYSFSGFETEKILLHFLGGKWFEMQVYLIDNDRISMANRFKEVVTKIMAKYGTPDKISLPKMVANWNDYQNEEKNPHPDLYDSEISQGFWIPEAVWRFGNQAVIELKVKTEFEGKKLVWSFYREDLKKLAEKKLLKSPVDDF